MSGTVALSLGDPAGIGGEIALKAWAALRDRLAFCVIGDVGYLRRLGVANGVEVEEVGAPAEAEAVMPRALPVLDNPLPVPPRPGVADAENAAATVAAVTRGVELVRAGSALALCTGPINKKALQEGAGFAFPGHTEYLAHLAGAELAVMMLAAPALRVVPVTVHVALAEVPARLTPALLERTLRVVHAAMVADFGLARPRIAVAGLNPHAGEGGTMGREEVELIAPVLDRLRAEGLGIAGPLSADTMCHEQARARYDVAVCMYHDQALIPLKAIDFAGGVNVTLGLEFVRTAPDHGTAYDIAGTGRADPTSLIAALGLAHAMGTRRRERG
jgi:4-hydroxythreonine-4-phosphate dehydrogenase